MYESLQNVQDGHYTEAERSRGRTLSTSNISENVFLSQTCFTEYSHKQTVFQKRKQNHSTDTLYLFKMYSNQLKNVEPGSISLFSEMHERCAGTCVSIHGTAWVKTEAHSNEMKAGPYKSGKCFSSMSHNKYPERDQKLRYLSISWASL